jgi:predicted ATP-grasp superfamily ATP-dependent carboligase
MISDPSYVNVCSDEKRKYIFREERFVRIGAFQLQDPLPECNEPYVLAILRPWLDVNNVGTLVLKELAARFGATELGKLATPGQFYDFTRYRPIIHLEEGIRDMSIPNTTIRYAKREGQNDLLLLRLLEPHAHAEFYISSVLKLLKTFKAKKYILLGSMYDMVPHTRPLLVSGYGMGEKAVGDMRKADILPIMYRGPSSIANLIAKEAAASGIEAIVLIVSLPQYVVLDEDYMGKLRLMEILNMLYNVPVAKEDFEKALEQRDIMNERLGNSPEMKIFLPQLENVYDARSKAMEKEGVPSLTPEMEELFWKMTGKDIGRA